MKKLESIKKYTADNTETVLGGGRDNKPAPTGSTTYIAGEVSDYIPDVGEGPLPGPDDVVVSVPVPA